MVVELYTAVEQFVFFFLPTCLFFHSLSSSLSPK